MSGPEARTLALAERLIAFDTTSTRSNRALMDFVANQLDEHGVAVELIPSAAEDKTNLLAVIGPEDAPGVVVSAHTDVVPQGEGWTTPAFAPEVRDGRLYGRGSADMKSFIALALANLPPLQGAGIDHRVVLALSFDEERGCLGAPLMMPRIAEMRTGLRGCIIGEPTSMRVATGHKGKLAMRVTVHGQPAHSAFPERGVNAIDVAAELIAWIRRTAAEVRVSGPRDEHFAPPHTTLHTGTVRGGTALNTVPAECTFDFEVRPLPGTDARAYVRDLRAFLAERMPDDLAHAAASARVEITELAAYPGLAETDQAFPRWVAELAGDPGEPTTLSFGTEAGLFSELGLPAVVCGPGSIQQAHKADEFVELEQLARGEAFFERLVAALRHGTLHDA